MKLIKSTLIVSVIIGVGLLSNTVLSSSSEKIKVAQLSAGDLAAALKAMPKGDPERGVIVSKQMMCNACHGEKGKPYTRNFPSIEGQNYQYTVKMMLDYREGRRWESYKRADVMVKIAENMTDQQIADVASFYAKQTTTAWESVAKQDHKKAIALVTSGDMSRMVMACAGCHGVKGKGSGLNPSLAGQIPEYFIRTLQAYHEKDRLNDVMLQFTKALTEEEVTAIANYYASLGETE